MLSDILGVIKNQVSLRCSMHPTRTTTRLLWVSRGDGSPKPTVLTAARGPTSAARGPLARLVALALVLVVVLAFALALGGPRLA